LKVVRSGNIMADSYAISDLVITAIEQQLSSEEPVSLALLNAIKAAKGSTPTQSLISKLEEAVDAKITESNKEPSNTIFRDTNRSYT